MTTALGGFEPGCDPCQFVAETILGERLCDRNRIVLGTFHPYWDATEAEEPRRLVRSSEGTPRLGGDALEVLIAGVDRWPPVIFAAAGWW